ncbi:epithelial-stromal interaction protein 1 isoform X4 [Manis pentadactyla]|uniref:epithelial-stromal interaction protein 1 isoform X4 n=1 Tax=Manis pentadactyla TaxID=143292 RepID=UPI00255CA99F|nr:epithelial-stromal interaction protein 1 isoform X4 [Manis pentadactyla]
MSTRTAVVGAAPRAAPAARPAPGPPGRRPEPEPLRSPSRESAEHAGRRLTGTYTLIAPNENRRNRIQRIAEQELENLEKWKEQHRAKPVSLVPRQLGGSQSEAEVRQKQQLQLMQAKYRQKLKREESVRIRKEAEEAEIQKMKAIQREKNELLEFKQQQQEEERTKTHQAEHRRIYEKYLLTPGLCQLNLKKLIRCFALRQLCTSSLFLSRLQVPIHSAEQPGLTCFSLLCMLVGADHRIHISSVLPVKSCIIFLIGFTSYWKCK